MKIWIKLNTIAKIINENEHKAFTLIELLVVVAIIGILAAVGVVAYNGYTECCKVSATKANHKMITKMIGAKGIQCSMGGDIEYTNVNGTVKTMSCRFDRKFYWIYESNHLWTKLSSPYGTPNPSWCRLNVTNCSPPGYMSACPSNPDQLGI